MRDRSRNAARTRRTAATLPVRNGLRRLADPIEPDSAGWMLNSPKCSHSQELIELRRDLHDQIGAALVGICLQLELVLLNLPEASGTASDGLRQAISDASTVVEQVRYLCSARSEPTASTIDLGAILANLVDRLNGLLGGRLRVELGLTGGLGEMPAQTASAAFLIAQEALTNVVKHSDASWCHLSVEVGADQLLLRVVDDGRGCADPTYQGGCGLPNMTSRARDQGGDCVAGPATPAGFAITAWLPLRGRNDETRET
jgi:signal transduction histidine kinase